MTHAKGWINRQITRVDREWKSWPDWMRRETEIRAEALKGLREDPQDEKLPSDSLKKADQA